MLKKYPTAKEVITDLQLDQIDHEVLLEYLFQFGPISFDIESRVLIINTKILNYRQTIERDGKVFKIRLEQDAPKYRTTKA